MEAIAIIKNRNKQNKQTQFLLVANGLIVGILILWLTVGNLLVAYLEQPMLKAQAEFVQRYPKREANSSAIALRDLYSKLKIIENIKDIRNYDELLYTDNNLISPLSEELKSYLASKSAIINEIITLLRKEPPQFEHYDLFKVFTDPLGFSNSSFLQWAMLQRLLSLEALQQYQSGQMQRVFDILTATWNLNLALQEEPYLISQLVALILFQNRVGFLRKISLPIEAQQQLVTPSFPKSILPALEIDNLVGASLLQVPSSKISQNSYQITKRSPSLIERILLPFQLPYFKLSGIDYWEKNMQEISKVQTQDICLFDPKILGTDIESTSSWWNVWGRSQGINVLLLGQLTKAYKRLIDWEFTQKILQAKATAAKTSNFPLTMHTIEYSTICKDLQYEYRFIDNGQKMTLQMQNLPKWYVYHGRGELPVTFNFIVSSNQPMM